MDREKWSIGCTFGYAIRVLNSIFCSDLREEQEYSEEERWLVVEQVNSLVSTMMLEDAIDIINMCFTIPAKRLCERTDCKFHHPKDWQKHSYRDSFKDKCHECMHNNYGDIGKDKPERDMDHFESE